MLNSTTTFGGGIYSR
ncbi:hypothetical protein DW902_04700, partial [Agathobacter rectalis]